MTAKPEASEVKGDFFTLNSEDRLRLLQPIRTREQIKRPAYAVEQSLKGNKTRIFLKKSLVVILKFLFQFSCTSVKFSRVHENNFQSAIKEKNLASDHHFN